MSKKAGKKSGKKNEKPVQANAKADKNPAKPTVKKANGAKKEDFAKAAGGLVADHAPKKNAKVIAKNSSSEEVKSEEKPGVLLTTEGALSEHVNTSWIARPSNRLKIAIPAVLLAIAAALASFFGGDWLGDLSIGQEESVSEQAPSPAPSVLSVEQGPAAADSIDSAGKPENLPPAPAAVEGKTEAGSIAPQALPPAPMAKEPPRAIENKKKASPPPKAKAKVKAKAKPKAKPKAKAKPVQKKKNSTNPNK